MSDEIDPDICLNCKKPPEACDTCDPLSPEREYQGPGSKGRPLSTDLSDPIKVKQRKWSKQWREKNPDANKIWRENNREYFKLYHREYRRKKKKAERSQA